MSMPAMLQPGNELPAITLPRLSGGDLSLAAFRGKRVLLFFWGSW
ncbi:MAG TPA: hypothetical protein VMW65_06400 [Chloroflexota bacterium]|nr:hypothetical protein [Chloroflexota bacterium]